MTRNGIIVKISDFINIWKEKNVSFYMDLLATKNELEAEYNKATEHMMVSQYQRNSPYCWGYSFNGTDRKQVEAISEEALESYDKCQCFMNSIGKGSWGLLRDYPSETSLKDKILPMIEKEGEQKKKAFIIRVEKKVGNIIDGGDFHLGRDGTLNGIVTGEAGTVEVRSILAWGPIQKPHYRVLLIKAKK